MEYGASCEDVARVCHAHPVSSISFCYIRKFSSRKGTIHLRRQYVLGGGGMSPLADGQKVTVHKDQKSPS